MIEGAEVEHAYAAVCAARDEGVDAACAELDVVDFFVVSDELCFCG